MTTLATMGKNTEDGEQQVTVNMPPPESYDASNNANATDSVAKAFDTLAKAVQPNQSVNQVGQW